MEWSLFLTNVAAMFDFKIAVIFSRYLQMEQLFLQIYHDDASSHFVSFYIKISQNTLHLCQFCHFLSFFGQLEKWWEEKAYMEVRAPAAVICNIVGSVTTMNDIWPPMDGTQLERAAIYTWYFLENFRMARK